MQQSKIEVRAMIRHKPTGKIGVIMANDGCGGIFRGHADIWLGEIDDQGPVVFQVCLNDWEQLECPPGFKREMPDEFRYKPDIGTTINQVNEGDITAREAIRRIRDK